MACGQRGQGIIQEITIEMEGTLCGDTTFEYCELLGEMGRCEGAIETETEGDVDQRLSHASVRRTPPPTTVTQHIGTISKCREMMSVVCQFMYVCMSMSVIGCQELELRIVTCVEL